MKQHTFIDRHPSKASSNIRSASKKSASENAKSNQEKIERIAQAAMRRQADKKKTIYLVFSALSAIFIILMAVILRNISDTKAFNGYMDQARSCYYSSDFDTALTYLRKASYIDTTDECMAMITQCYESLGNYDKALETLRKMDTSNSQVSQWIDELESRRTLVRQSNLVSVAGKQYKSDTTGIALDNMGLGNNVIDELQQLYSLDNLSLAGNSISDISGISALGGLTTLNLSNNNISDITPLTQLLGLRTLYLDYNPISNIAMLSQLANLSTLSIKGIDLSDGDLKKLASALPNCAIHSEAAEEENQDISFGGSTFSADVVELNLAGMGIQNISALSNCKNLQKLDLSGNYISDLTPLMDLPNLQWLNLSNNSISDLRPLMGISSLRFLNVSGNLFYSTVSLGNLSGLTELHISDNNISNFSGLRKLTALRTLGMSNCCLTNEGLTNLVNLQGLTNLNIENNEQLTGEAVQSLKTSLYACNVTHSQLAYMVYIENYAYAADSYNIDLSGLNIYDISNIGGFTAPETINLSHNNISNIYPLMTSENRYLIKHLNLSYNQIQDASALSALSYLETLDVSFNFISSELPFLSLYNLRQLDVSGTQLSIQQVQILRDNLPMCYIISSFG